MVLIFLAHRHKTSELTENIWITDVVIKYLQEKERIDQTPENAMKRRHESYRCICIGWHLTCYVHYICWQGENENNVKISSIEN